MTSFRRRPIALGMFALLLVAAPAAVVSSTSHQAHASVSVAVTVDDLVSHADRVIVAQATHQESRWEKVDGSRRIVTYTHFDVDDRLFGESTDKLAVRTLGGIVGKVGQQVAGEAEFRLGKMHLLFLRNVNSAHIVVARAQGHYPLKQLEKDNEPVLALSPSAGKILRRSGPRVSAQDQLQSKKLSAARDLILQAKKAVDTRKKKNKDSGKK